MWTLVPPLEGKNIVRNKSIFRIKPKADGYVILFRAHLVAKGYNQQHGTDFEETFNVAINLVIICHVLSITSNIVGQQNS